MQSFLYRTHIKQGSAWPVWKSFLGLNCRPIYLLQNWCFWDMAWWGKSKPLLLPLVILFRKESWQAFRNSLFNVFLFSVPNQKTWSTSFEPPIIWSQSSTTSISKVGVKSSSKINTVLLNLTVPTFARDTRRQSTLAFLNAKRKSLDVKSPLRSKFSFSW